MVSFNPSEEQQMIVNTVKEFTTGAVRRAYREADETGHIPAELIDTGWGFGFTSVNIPEYCHGSGEPRSSLTGTFIAEELAWGDLSTALNILSPMLVTLPLVEMGTEEQKKRYLGAFCGDNFKAATAALLEPRYAFDTSELTTTAQRDNGDYVLNGQKCYVPLAEEADLILVYASEGDQIQGFLVEGGTVGLEIGEREKNMGIKALPTYELGLRDCRVPATNRLGGEAGCDFARLLSCSRVALSAMAIGVARAAFEYACDYAKERHAFGEPIASRQAIAFMLAEMSIEIDATRLMVWETAWKLDRGEDATKEAYLTKGYADDMVSTVTDNAVQVLGGHGFIREHPVELWFRNGRGFATFDGIAMV